ncbi:hypothetical protein ABT330_27975 [Streptomyces sp. NPDC000658]|uniref:hypothetical protein n=1 Tax=Streptomyces sp. NPDC000658 TaxID=3154266 RepID=UPI00332B2665
MLLPESEEVTPSQLRARQAELVAAARRELEAVASTVLGERFASIATSRSEGDGREHFVLRDTRGGEATLWVDAVPMESGILARSVANTASGNYIVQVSDRLPTASLSLVLAHEVGELIAVRDRSGQGLAPVRENFLRPGAELGDRAELSSQDHGRIGELNWLAARASDNELTEQSRAEARAELSALLDRCGLRPVTAAADAEPHHAEARAARARRLASKDFLSFDAERLVEALGHPLEHLSPADATALQASRAAARRAERQVDAFIAGRDVTMPMPGYDQNGLPLPRDQLEAVAVQWAEYRAQVARRTVQALEGQLANGEFPLHKVVIGGGASLTGRSPDALLVDAVGRWHLDPGDGIVQSADQDRDLARWMGVDPYSAVADPRHRISIHAVRVWEDQLASQGDLVNGRARLRLGRGGELLAEVHPLGDDGKESTTPLWVACDGTPTIATGLTPELLPGMPRGPLGVESRGEAVRLIGDRLRDLAGEGVPGAEELRARLTDAERRGADTRAVLDALNSSASPTLRDALTAGLDEDAAARMGNCFTALDSTLKWEAAREAAPGRALLGDEVAEGRFDAHRAGEWIVVGSGGTAVANAEIILIRDPTAHVTIIGSEPPPALRHQVQFPAMQEKYGHGEHGEKRLTFVEARVGAIETYLDDQGGTRFQVPYTEKGTGERRVARSDGYVTSLGRTNPLPPALQVLAHEVRDRGGEISGDLMFDRDDQYIGYGLTFAVDGREHRIDVDGAAAWQLPREIFAPETGLQGELNAMGLRGLPSETGNAAPGFSPVARQSVLRARALAAAAAGDPEAVRRRSTIPPRWQRPDLGQAPEAPAPAHAHAHAPAPAPAPAHSHASTPAPAPNPAPGIPGSHLWQAGVVSRGGSLRPPARARDPQPPAQPQRQPPAHERPDPGVGMGD